MKGETVTSAVLAVSLQGKGGRLLVLGRLRSPLFG